MEKTLNFIALIMKTIDNQLLKNCQ